MNRVRFLSKIVLAVSVAFALAFITSCVSMFSGMYPVPENMRKSYEKTIYAPNASAELLSKKIKLHFFDNFSYLFIDKECNLISGIHQDPKGGSSNTDFRAMMKTEVFVNSGQYRVVSAIEHVYAKQDEIEQKLKDILPEVEKDWQIFIQELEQITTKNFTDEEIEKLVQQGNAEMQKKEFTKAKEYFLKVAIANPNNAEFLILYGKSLESIGKEAGCANKFNCDIAIANFDMALHIFWLVKEHPEAARAMSELLQHKQVAEQRAAQFDAQRKAMSEAMGKSIANSAGIKTGSTSTTASTDKSEKLAIQLNKAASNWSSCIETQIEN